MTASPVVYFTVSRIMTDSNAIIERPVDIIVTCLPQHSVNQCNTNLINQHLVKSNSLFKCYFPASSLNSAQCKIAISIARNSNRIATVTIPVSWLPQNQVVSGWFPMKIQRMKSWKNSPFAFIKFHFDTIGVKPFSAQNGSLLAKPAWKVPEQISRTLSTQQQQEERRTQQIYQQPIQQFYFQQPLYPPQNPFRNQVQPLSSPNMQFYQHQSFMPAQNDNPYQQINQNVNMNSLTVPIQPPQSPQSQPSQVNVTYPRVPQFVPPSPADIPKVSYPFIQ